MKKFVIAAAAALFAAHAGAAAVVIPDYSFESPNLGSGGYTYNPTVSGVTFNARSGVQANGSAFGFTNAPDGNQTAFLQSDANYAGAISIALSGLTVGQAYTLAFYAASRPGYSDDAFTVAFGGTQIGSYDVTQTAWAQYVTNSFVATATTGTLSFTSYAYGGGDHDVGLDALSISAVPEPASWMMMIGGFGLAGAMLRRRNRAAIHLA